MTRSSVWCTCVLALALAACDDKGILDEIVVPYAQIHWIHAVPDTGQMDYRVVDIPSNAGLYDANFRGSNMFPQPIEAGSRQVRVFMSDTTPAIASTVVEEVPFTFVDNTAYTFLHTGFARTGQTPARRVLILPEAPPAPGTGNIGIRVLHAGAGLGNVDGHVLRRATDTVPDAPLIANVAYAGASSYVQVAADAAAADSVRVVLTNSGTKTVVANLRAPTGAAGTTTASPIGGARVAGSVLTAVLVPASVTGSRAPQGGAFAAPSVVYLVERRPGQ